MKQNTAMAYYQKQVNFFFHSSQTMNSCMYTVGFTGVETYRFTQEKHKYYNDTTTTVEFKFKIIFLY